MNELLASNNPKATNDVPMYIIWDPQQRLPCFAVTHPHDDPLAYFRIAGFILFCYYKKNLPEIVIKFEQVFRITSIHGSW